MAVKTIGDKDSFKFPAKINTHTRVELTCSERLMSLLLQVLLNMKKNTFISCTLYTGSRDVMRFCQCKQVPEPFRKNKFNSCMLC